MKLRYLAAGVLVAAGLALSGTPVYATEPAAPFATRTFETDVISTPDDTVGGEPWARDSFSRVTSVKGSEDGTITVAIADSGTFRTPSGVKGTLRGEMRWTVKGGTLLDTADAPATIDRSSATDKGTFTSAWWKRFVKDGTAEVLAWRWTYKTPCETYAESSSEREATGRRPSLTCPTKPIPSPSKPFPSKPVPSSASVSPSASQSASGGPVPTETPTEPVSGPQLPITGPGVGTFVAFGGLILGAGIAAVTVAEQHRRRRVRKFSA